MSHHRTRAWRRQQRAKTHKHEKNRGFGQIEINNRIYKTKIFEKSFKFISLRQNKLHRAKQLGMVWPDREKRELMMETSSLNILFICSMNQWRSPTGEKIWSKSAVINTRSAGTSKNARRKVGVQELRWADLILVMEEKHLNRIRANFRDEVRYKDIRVLDIEDNYQFMAPELIEILEMKINPILEEKLGEA